MGRSNSWIAVRGVDRSDVVQRLGLEETGREADWGQAHLRLADTGSGWLIVHAMKFDYPTPDLLAALSAGGEVVSCQVEEHVMVSVAQGFRDGRKAWAATHDPETSLYSLEVEGAPPPELAAIQKRLRADQDAAGGEDADVDFMFDAAPEIATQITGYRDDEDQGLVFMELQRPRPPKGPGLFKRLFGGR